MMRHLLEGRSGADISSGTRFYSKTLHGNSPRLRQDQVKQSFPLNGRHSPLRTGPTARALVRTVAERPTVVPRCNMLGSLYTD